MAQKWKFCPMCAQPLEDRMVEHAMLRACTSCSFIDYDNPIPVAAALIPYQRGIVLVQRGIPPFEGEWCLPCGYVNATENPKAAARREAGEESGLLVRCVTLINACTPHVPGIRLNQLVLIYLARVLGGEVRRGDDARDARVFRRNELPKICFGSHELAVNDWFAGRLGTLTRPRQKIDRTALGGRR